MFIYFNLRILHQYFIYSPISLYLTLSIFYLIYLHLLFTIYIYYINKFHLNLDLPIKRKNNIFNLYNERYFFCAETGITKIKICQKLTFIKNCVTKLIYLYIHFKLLY